MVTGKQMKTSQPPATKRTKSRPSAAALLAKIEALAKRLQEIEHGHGNTMLSATQLVRDRMNGRDF
jgi:hypothetical protein